MTWELLLKVILLMAVFAVLFSWVLDEWHKNGAAARCVEHEFKLTKDREFKVR